MVLYEEKSVDCYQIMAISHNRFVKKKGSAMNYVPVFGDKAGNSTALK